MAMVVWKALTQVNITDAGVPPDTNEQSGSTLTALGGGQFLVGWSDFTNTFSAGLGAPDSIGQVYDPQGARAGGEAHLSGVFFDGGQKSVDVAAMPGGGYIAVYQSDDQAFFTTGENVFYEIFDSIGNLIGQRISGLPPGGGGFTDMGFFQLGNETDPTVASFGDGSFLVAYADDSSGNQDILGFAVNAAGQEQASFVIADTADDETEPEAAALSNGSVAIVYRSAANASDIMFSVKTGAGGAVASGTVAGGAQAETAPAVAGLRGAGGGFVVAWADANGDGAGNAGIKVRLYSNAGVAAGAAVSANLTVTAGVQSAPAVTGLLDGGFLVAWVDEASGDVRGRRFDAAGAAIETEFVMASLDDFSEPELVTLEDGRIALSATNTDGTGDKDIFAVIWDPRSSPINGTAGNDVLTTLTTASTVNGLAGDDVLISGAGNDTLAGGGNSDTADWSRATAALAVALNAAGSGAITAAGIGSDTYSDIESMRGGTAGDVLTGNAAANTLRGGGGSDTLNGMGGNDTADYSDALSAATIDLRIVTQNVTGGLGVDQISNFENVIGGNFDDRLIGTAVANVLTAGGGDDTVFALAGNDVLTGGAGDDYLAGGADNDTIYGGNGFDLWLGGDAGNDIVDGGERNDRVDGGEGNDTVSGGADFDTVTGGGGDDTVNGDGASDLFLGGGAGLDTVNGGEGDDRMDGGADNDTLNGGTGNDNMTGGTGADAMNGGDGRDRILGESGDDTLTGGLGFDQFTGGAGNDIFRFAVAEFENRITTGVYDNIYDYSRDGGNGNFDRIQLQGVATEYSFETTTSAGWLRIIHLATTGTVYVTTAVTADPAELATQVEYFA